MIECGKAFSPLNPPKLGDFERGSPQNWGQGGQIISQFSNA